MVARKLDSAEIGHEIHLKDRLAGDGKPCQQKQLSRHKAGSPASPVRMWNKSVAKYLALHKSKSEVAIYYLVGQTNV